MARQLALAASIALALASGAALAQTSHTKVAQRDLNLPPSEGRCELRVWVDDIAVVRLRGDDVWVDTLRGRRSYDTGSTCSQPLPLQGAGDFHVARERGRGLVQALEAPSRRNDYTGAVQITDPDNGASLYVVTIAWNTPGNSYGMTLPAPATPVAVTGTSTRE